MKYGYVLVYEFFDTSCMEDEIPKWESKAIFFHKEVLGFWKTHIKNPVFANSNSVRNVYILKLP